MCEIGYNSENNSVAKHLTTSRPSLVQSFFTSALRESSDLCGLPQVAHKSYNF